MEYLLPYNLASSHVAIDLPGDKVVLIEPRKLAARPLDEAVGSAVDEILGRLKASGRLRENCKVAVAIDDHTRPTPTSPLLDKLVPILVEEYGAEVTVLFALGTHEPPPEEYVRVKTGNRAYRLARVVIHNAYDYGFEHHVFKGVTSLGTPLWVNREFADADVRIGVGSIFPSEIAGFTGGCKIVLPGVSHYYSINRNHSMFVSPKAVIGSLENPIRRDIDEAGVMAGLDVLSDFVLNPDNTVVDVFVGDPVKAHRKGVMMCRAIYEARSAPRCDLVIGAPGGTEDIEFVQASKALFTMKQICGSRGAIVLVAACRLGVAWPELLSLLEYARSKKLSREELLRLAFRDEYESLAVSVAYKLYDILVSHRIKTYLVSRELSYGEAEDLGLELLRSPEELPRGLVEKARRIAVVPMAAYSYLAPGRGLQPG